MGSEWTPDRRFNVSFPVPLGPKNDPPYHDHNSMLGYLMMRYCIESMIQIHASRPTGWELGVRYSPRNGKMEMKYFLTVRSSMAGLGEKTDLFNRTGLEWDRWQPGSDGTTKFSAVSYKPSDVKSVPKPVVGVLRKFTRSPGVYTSSREPDTQGDPVLRGLSLSEEHDEVCLTYSMHLQRQYVVNTLFEGVPSTRVRVDPDPDRGRETLIVNLSDLTSIEGF